MQVYETSGPRRCMRTVYFHGRDGWSVMEKGAWVPAPDRVEGWLVAGMAGWWVMDTRAWVPALDRVEGRPFAG